MALPLVGTGYDLHTHSVYSDGTTTPAEIAAEAAQVGLAGFALTDHDSIDGWGEAREAAAQHGVSFLPGIEITTTHRGGSRHLLGYGIDPRNEDLFLALREVRDARLERVKEMVRRVSVNYVITLDEVVGAGDVATVGRPHIADALVAKGYFVDRSQAFEQLLHPASPYYLSTLAIDAREAIRLVQGAGGVSVLAHPAALRQRAAIAVTDITELAAAGLWGVETDHPENRDDWMPPILRAVSTLGLIATGSSDYHGLGKPNRLGERRTSAEVVAQLRERVVTPQ